MYNTDKPPKFKPAFYLTPNESYYTESFDKYRSYIGDTPDISAINDTYGSIEEYAALNQDRIDKWANATGKMGILAATTFGDAFIGTAFGIGNVLIGNSFIDNPWTRFSTNIQDWSEEIMPNLYTYEERNASLLGKMGTANFWSDGVLKNLGFAIGAFAAAAVGNELIFSKLPFLNTAKDANKLFRGIAANSDDIAKTGIKSISGNILRTEDDVLKAFYNKDLNIAQFGDDMIKTAKAIENKNLALKLTSIGFGAQGEARFEAIRTGDEAYKMAINDIIDDKRKNAKDNNPYITDEELQDINENSLDENDIKEAQKRASIARNVDFALNIGILTAGDMVQFGKYLGRGYKTENKIAGKLGYLGKKISQDGENLILKKNNILDKAVIGVKMLKNPFAEGTEEQLQLASQYGSEDFVNRLYDDNATSTVEAFIKGMGTGLSKAYGTQEGWENFFLGAFTGALGIPSFKIGGKWLSGGIAEDISKYNKEKKFINSTIEAINKDKENFQKLLKGVIINQSYENDKQIHLENEDPFNYKNAEAMQLATMALTYYNLGKLNIVNDNIEMLKKMSADEIRNNFIIKKDKNGKDLPEDKWIKPYDNLSDDEIKRQYNKRLENIQKSINRLKELKEASDVKFAQLSNESRDAMVIDLFLAENTEKRQNEIIDELAKLQFKDGMTAKEIAESLQNIELNKDKLEQLLSIKKQIFNIKYNIQRVIDNNTKSVEEKEKIINNYNKQIEDLEKENNIILSESKYRNIDDYIESNLYAVFNFIKRLQEETDTGRYKTFNTDDSINELRKILVDYVMQPKVNKDKINAYLKEVESITANIDKIKEKIKDREYKLEEAKNDINKIKNDIKELKSKIDNDVAEENKKRENVVENFTNKYKAGDNKSFEEYQQEVYTLLDKIMYFQQEAEKFYKQNPHIATDVYNYVTDISKLEILKRNAFINYTNHIDKLRNGKDLISEKKKKIYNEIKTRKTKLLIERFKNEAKFKSEESPEFYKLSNIKKGNDRYILELINGEYYLKDKNGKVDKVTIDEKFVNEYELIPRPRKEEFKESKDKESKDKESEDKESKDKESEDKESKDEIIKKVIVKNKKTKELFYKDRIIGDNVKLINKNNKNQSILVDLKKYKEEYEEIGYEEINKQDIDQDIDVNLDTLIEKPIFQTGFLSATTFFDYSELDEIFMLERMSKREGNFLTENNVKIVEEKFKDDKFKISAFRFWRFISNNDVIVKKSDNNMKYGLRVFKAEYEKDKTGYYTAICDDNGNYIDIDGNIINDNDVLEKGLFLALPEPNKYFVGNIGKINDKDVYGIFNIKHKDSATLDANMALNAIRATVNTTKEEYENEIIRYDNEINTIKSDVDADKKVILKINDIVGGFTVFRDNFSDDTNAVSTEQYFQNESEKKEAINNIKIKTKWGDIVYNRVIRNIAKGRICTYVNGKLINLFPKKLSEWQVKTVINILEQLIDSQDYKSMTFKNIDTGQEYDALNINLLFNPKLLVNGNIIKHEHNFEQLINSIVNFNTPKAKIKFTDDFKYIEVYDIKQNKRIKIPLFNIVNNKIVISEEAKTYLYENLKYMHMNFRSSFTESKNAEEDYIIPIGFDDNANLPIIKIIKGSEYIQYIAENTTPVEDGNKGSLTRINQNILFTYLDLNKKENNTEYNRNDVINHPNYVFINDMHYVKGASEYWYILEELPNGNFVYKKGKNNVPLNVKDKQVESKLNFILENKKTNINSDKQKQENSSSLKLDAMIPLKDMEKIIDKNKDIILTNIDKSNVFIKYNNVWYAYITINTDEEGIVYVKAEINKKDLKDLDEKLSKKNSTTKNVETNNVQSSMTVNEFSKMSGIDDDTNKYKNFYSNNKDKSKDNITNTEEISKEVPNETSENTFEDTSENISDDNDEIFYNSDDNNETPFRKYELGFINYNEYERFDKLKKDLDRIFGENVVSVERVAYLINGNSYGAIKKAMMYIYEYAPRGTGMHEAWHIVENGFLTPDEINILRSEIEELIKSDKKINEKFEKIKSIYSNLSRKDQISELLAEMFAEYAQQQENEKSTINNNKILRIFKRILNWIKRFIYGDKKDSQYINKIFENAYSGKYSNKILQFSDDNIKYRSFKNDNNNIYNTERFSNMISKSMMILFNSHLEQYLSKNNLSLIDVFVNGLSDKALKHINGMIRNDFMSNFGEFLTKLEASKTKYEYNFYKEKLDAIQFVVEHFNEAISIFNENFKQYNINLDINGDELYVDKDTKEAGNSITSITESSLRISPKENATSVIKFLLCSIKDEKSGLNELGFYEPIDFSSLFLAIIQKTANTTSISDVKKALYELSKNNIPGIHKLIGKLKFDKPYNLLTLNDVALQNMFAQTFCKTKNNFFIGIINDDGNIVLIDSNYDTAKRKMLSKWKSNMFLKNRKYLINNGKDGYIYNIENIKKDFGNKLKYDDTIKFLNSIGLQITKSDDDKKIEYIYENIAHGIFNLVISGKLLNIFSLNKDNDLGGRINELIRYELDNNSSELMISDNCHYNRDGNLVYDNTIYGYINMFLARINSLKNNNVKLTKAFLQKEFPFLKSSYLNNSLFLDAILKGENIKIIFLESIVEEKVSKFHVVEKMREPSLINLRIEMSKHGYIALNRPADNGQERFILTKNIVIPNDIFIKYLHDDISHRVEIFSDINIWKHTDNANIDNSWKSPTLSIIKEFSIDKNKTEYFFSIVKDIIEGKRSKEFIDILLDENKEFINNCFNRYIENEANKLFNKCLRYKLISKRQDKDMYFSNGLGYKNHKSKEEIINNILKPYINKVFIFSTEQNKLFFGDPIFSKSVLDRIKRNNIAISTKGLTFSEKKDSDYESWYKEKFKKISGPYEYYTNGELIFNSLIIDDIDVYLPDKVVDELSKSTGLPKENFSKVMTENDAMGYMTLDALRVLAMRSGKWNNLYEKFYQYIYQKYCAYLVENKKMTAKRYKELFDKDHTEKKVIDPITKKEIRFSDIEKVKLNSWKIQSFGYIADNGAKPTGYKTSVHIISPTLFMNPKTKEVEFKNLKRLHDFLIKNNIDGMFAYSANKSYTTKGNRENGKFKLQSFYKEDKDGNIAFSEIESPIIQKVYYNNFGVQLETGFKRKTKQSVGTQLNGIIQFGSMSNGEIIDGHEKLEENILKYIDLNSKRIEYGKKLLIKKLGIKKIVVNETECYKIDNIEKFKSELKKIAYSRNQIDNLIDSIDNLGNNMYMETMLYAIKLEPILIKLTERMTTDIEFRGLPSYQVASSFMEKDNIVYTQTKEKNKFYLTNPRLKMSMNEDGKVTRMEIMLPSIYKGYFDVNKDIDPRLLEGIGFRIPTQGLSSVDAIVIKDFINDSYGNVVILPTEIVAKAGSDYDIDKLNIYLKHGYRTIDGYKQLPDTYEEYVKERNKVFLNNFIKKLDNVFRYKLSYRYDNATSVNDIIKLEKIEKFINFLYAKSVNYDIKQTSEFILSEIEKAIGKTDAYISNFLKDVATDILGLTNNFNNIFDTLLSEEEFNLMITENKLIDKIGDIILDPLNFRRLNTNVSSEKLKKIMNEINDLKGIKSNDNLPYHNINSDDFLSSITIENFDGKGAVGILAVCNKFHQFATRLPLSMKGKLYFNKFRNLDKISLSSIKDIEGNYIYEDLSEFISAAVDNAKELILKNINAGTQIINTIMYLRLSGVPIRDILYFVNQPIIIEYLENQKVNESTFANVSNIATTKAVLIKETISKFTSATKIDNNIHYDTEMLKNAIADKGSNGVLQAKILYDFIEYQENAKKLSEVMQIVRLDIDTFGGNSIEIVINKAKIYKILNDEVNKEGIENIHMIFGLKSANNMYEFDDKISEKAFMHPYYKMLMEFPDIYRDIYIKFRNKNNIILNELKNVILSFMDRKVGLSNDELNDLMYNWQNSLITYAILTKNVNDEILSDSTVIDQLIRGDNSVAKRIHNLKDNPLFADNMVIKLVNTSIGIDYIDNIKPFDNIFLSFNGMNVIEKNQFVNDWNNLYNSNEHDLAVDIAKLLMIQSGYGYSSMSFMEFMPNSIYNEIFSDISERLLSITNEEIKYFSLVLWPLNNYNNDKLVPKVKYVQDYQNPYEHDITAYNNKSRSQIFAKKHVLIKEESKEQKKIYKLRPIIYNVKWTFDTTKNIYIPKLSDEYKNFNTILLFRNNISLLDYKKPNNIIGKNNSYVSMNNDTDNLEKGILKKSIEEQVEYIFNKYKITLIENNITKDDIKILLTKKGLKYIEEYIKKCKS